MKVEKTPLEGVLVLTRQRFGDARGWFSETWNRARMAEAGIDVDFVQDNHSMSAAKGTLRGLHYQAPPHAQAKLVRCTAGLVRDVAVDFRAGSPTFGRWFAVELSPGNGRQLFVPPGFLHGFVTCAPNSEVQYKCSDVYAPDCDRGLRWDHPDIGIDWGIDWGLDGAPVLSDKDRDAPRLREVASPFTWSKA